MQRITPLKPRKDLELPYAEQDARSVAAMDALILVFKRRVALLRNKTQDRRRPKQNFLLDDAVTEAARLMIAIEEQLCLQTTNTLI